MDEEKKVEQENNEATPIISKKAFKEKLAKKDEEIASLKEEAAKWKNEFYRVYADTENLRKSLEKDYRQALRYRGEGFIEKLLPVIDSFNMALQNKPTDPALINYLTGFEYIYKNMISAIQSEGVSEIRPKIGDKFDASTMNAIDTVEVDDQEENKVMQVYCIGIKLHDRIIRHANVIVSKKTIKVEEETDKNSKEASEYTEA